MTIKELIKQLSQYNGDMEVFGGDWCTGTNDHECGYSVGLSPITCKEISVAKYSFLCGEGLVTDLDRTPDNYPRHEFTLTKNKKRKAIYLG
tara:strand:+ start:675 stop:947 length:273 start_codon:yes stop_codon:yes gene_type:complete